jgi:predicted MFS family arabinose efflux permease
VGGLLVAAGGWRSIFLVNLPLVAAALALGVRSIPRQATSRIRTPRRSPLGAFGLFRRPAFAGATGAVALSNFAMYVTLLSLPILFARREGWDSSTTGLVLAAMSVAMCAASPLGGRLADRAGRRLPTVWGLALAAAGLVPLALAPATLPVPALIVCLVAIGGGVGVAGAPLQVAAIESAEGGSAGLASGMFSTARYAGSIAGTSLLAGPLAPAAHGLGGFGLLFETMAIAAAAAVLLALAIPGRRDRPPRATPSAAAAGARASG